MNLDLTLDEEKPSTIIVSSTTLKEKVDYKNWKRSNKFSLFHFTLSNCKYTSLLLWH